MLERDGRNEAISRWPVLRIAFAKNSKRAKAQGRDQFPFRRTSETPFIMTFYYARFCFLLCFALFFEDLFLPALNFAAKSFVARIPSTWFEEDVFCCCFFLSGLTASTFGCFFLFGIVGLLFLLSSDPGILQRLMRIGFLPRKGLSSKAKAKATASRLCDAST